MLFLNTLGFCQPWRTYLIHVQRSGGEDSAVTLGCWSSPRGRHSGRIWQRSVAGPVECQQRHLYIEHKYKYGMLRAHMSRH